MPRKQKKYHYLYKTTNLINNKFYVGMHSTDDLNDGYLGSGKHLRNSVNYYGKQNFKFEILEFFEDRITLRKKEEDFVNLDFIKDPMCMNLMKGGNGGFVSIEACTKGAVNRFLKFNEDPGFIQRRKERGSNIFKKLWKEGKIKNADWTGKKHNQESKNKISIANSINQAGEKNSQFGTCWITNKKDNKKIKKEELSLWLTQGWIKGRI